MGRQVKKRRIELKTNYLHFFASSAHKFCIGIDVVLTLWTIFHLLDSHVCTLRNDPAFFLNILHSVFWQNIRRQIVSKIILSRALVIYYNSILLGTVPFSKITHLHVMCADIRFNSSNVIKQLFNVEVNQKSIHHPSPALYTLCVKFPNIEVCRSRKNELGN